MKLPAFTLSGSTITDTKSGMTVDIIKEGDSYKPVNYRNTGTLKQSRIEAIAKRMTDWYYYNHVGKQ